MKRAGDTILRVGFMTALFIAAPLLPKKERARVLLVNDANEILLVRGRFGLDEWELPGGGTKRGETFAQAATRELREELGIELTQDQLRTLGSYKTTHRIAPLRLRAFAARIAEPQPRVSSWELVEARWWPLADLPEDVHNTFHYAVESWKKTIY